MITVNKKTNLSLALSLFLLAGCAGTNNAGIAHQDRFVSVLGVDDVKVSVCYLKTFASSLGGGGAAGIYDLSAHETDFFSNDDYKYSYGSVIVTGHSDPANGFYYLIGNNNASGYLFQNASALDGHRAVAKRILSEDVSFLNGIYAQMKTFASWDEAAIASNGYQSVEVLYSDISTTLGFSAKTVKKTADATDSIDYFVTLDKKGTGYFFTDVVVRQKSVSLSDGIASYFNYDWHLTLVDEYGSQTFNMNSYSIALADSDIASIDPNSVIQTL
jgi:hypothetical protein